MHREPWSTRSDNLDRRYGTSDRQRQPSSLPAGGRYSSGDACRYNIGLSVARPATSEPPSFGAEPSKKAPAKSAGKRSVSMVENSGVKGKSKAGPSKRRRTDTFAPPPKRQFLSVEPKKAVESLRHVSRGSSDHGYALRSFTGNPDAENDVAFSRADNAARATATGENEEDATRA